MLAGMNVDAVRAWAWATSIMPWTAQRIHRSFMPVSAATCYYYPLSLFTETWMNIMDGILTSEYPILSIFPAI